MKKGLLRIAAIAFAAGLLLAIAGWAMGGHTSMTVNLGGRPITVGLTGAYWHNGGWESAGTGGWDSLEERDLESFQNINIDVSLGDVDFVAADDFGVGLQWNTEDELHYEVKNGTLRVWDDKIPHFGMNPGMGSSAYVTVYFPAGTVFDRVEVVTGLGDAMLGEFETQDLDVTADLGDVDLSNVAAGQAELNLSLGNLDAYGFTTEKKLTVTADLGNVLLDGDFRGKTEINADLGNVEVYTKLPARDYSYDLDADLGDVTVDDTKQKDHETHSGGDHTLTVDADLGNITVYFG